MVLAVFDIGWGVMPFAVIAFIMALQAKTRLKLASTRIDALEREIAGMKRGPG